MSADVAIVDYGIGNIYSVRRALEHSGAEVVVSADREVLLGAPRLVLPGVGAFADGMRGLETRGLADAVVAFAASGKPMLGICLGMQMLGTVGEEFGEHPGLDIIPGRVRALAPARTDGTAHKIPHVGWARLTYPNGDAARRGSILEGLDPQDAVYLVHSYALTPDDPGDRLAECDYGGHAIVVAVRRGNVSGTQFHPEKSGPVGLRIIRNFLAQS